MRSIHTALSSRLFTLCFALLACLWLNACLIVEVNFDANGGGTMKMAVSGLDKAGHERMKRKLVSPSVKLLSAELDKDVGVYEIAFEDAEKLRTAPNLSQLRVQRVGEAGGEQTITMTLPRRPKTPADKPEKLTQIGIDLTMTVPGTLKETNGTKLADSKASWKFKMNELIGEGRIGARATYAPAVAKKETAPDQGASD